MKRSTSQQAKLELWKLHKGQGKTFSRLTMHLMEKNNNYYNRRCLMSKRKSTKLRTFLGRTIHDIKYFIEACLRKITNEIVLHVSIDNVHTNVQDMLMIVIIFSFKLYIISKKSSNLHLCYVSMQPMLITPTKY